MIQTVNSFLNLETCETKSIYELYNIR